MTDQADDIIEAFDSRVKRRTERRELFRAVMGATALGAGFAFATAAEAQTVTDNDILNFALNLEYLEAQFYSYAATGTGLSSSLLSGVTTTGAQGAVAAGGANPPRAVDFTGDPLVGQYAREIAIDEAEHVAFLRTALGTAAVAQPAININGGLNPDGTPGSFTQAARAAGVVDRTNGIFDPYSSPTNFLLGAYIFEDVGVTAYKGAAPLLSSKIYLEAAAGILAVEAYHSAIVRASLFARDTTTPVSPTGGTVPQTANLIQATTQISAARDLLDGTPTEDLLRGIGPNDDQGIAPTTVNGGTASNISLLNSNGLAFSRTTGQVLNIVYLTRAAATMGGFFPAGVNGTIRSSTAN